MANLGTFVLLESVYCCRKEHKARVYNLPSKRGRWKKLLFLDECPYCGNTVASLQECTKDGELRIIARKTGPEALILRNKLAKFINKDFKTRSGSFSNEIIFYNNKGIVFNFNNYKVGKNEDFCKKSFEIIH